MFYLLSGEAPFEEVNQKRTLDNIKNVRIKKIVKPDVPAEAMDLLKKIFVINVEERIKIEDI